MGFIDYQLDKFGIWGVLMLVIESFLVSLGLGWVFVFIQFIFWKWMFIIFISISAIIIIKKFG